MIPRRKIREAVVQLVYCTDFEGSTPNPEAREAFWTLLNEDDIEAISIAQAKALIHLCSGRDIRVEALEKRQPAVDEVMKPLAETEPLRNLIKSLVAAEKMWMSDFHEVTRRIKSTSEAEKRELPKIIAELLVNDRALKSRREAIKLQALDFPAFQHALDPIISSLRKLQNLSDRAQLIGDPDNYGNHPAVAHLRPKVEDQKALRTQVEDMANAISRHQAEIDRHIASLSENYAPERINPIERCILRLGVYEILYVPDVPPAVAINEALEITKAFSTEDSFRFVNGILDTVAKGLPQEAPEESNASDLTPPTTKE